MSLPRSSATLAAFAGAACLAFAPTASAATTYTVTVVPPIGTVFSSTITTLAVVVGPVPSGADATTPVTLALTEPDGDTTSFTVPLTLGGATRSFGSTRRAATRQLPPSRRRRAKRQPPQSSST